MDANGYLTIENRLYVSYSRSTLGTRTSLGTLEQYSLLPDRYTYPCLLYPSHALVHGVGQTIRR